MAGTFTKQATWLSAKYLNDVNDVTAQGQIQSVPSSVAATQGNQTIPGDRIIMDDATAYANSDTAVGTLYGGIYMYVQMTYVTTAPQVGSIAFFRSADIGATTFTSPITCAYVADSDPQPSSTLPTYVLGIFISVPTKSQYCWIQIAGVASVLFDATPTNTATGNMVVAAASQLGGLADNGVTITQATWAAQIGVSVAAVTTSGVSKVAILRGFGRL